jgi:hypothetical protein
MGSESHKQLLALWTALDGGPRPRCRDCADYNGRCPSDNLPCEPQDRALEQIENLRRLAAKPADEGVRERIITTCANIANRYRPNLTARDIEQQIRALSTTGEPKR